jgi:two-component system, cell cycle response regulator
MNSSAAALTGRRLQGVNDMDSNIIEHLSSPALLEKISDVIRIVDPVGKQVIEYKNDAAVVGEMHCFDFWGRNKVCDNCISMRSYNDNNTYVKIEYKKDKTYMVTAVPYPLPDRRIVVEMLKDITSSLLFDAHDELTVEQSGIHALIDNMNKLAFSDSLTGLFNRRYIMEKLPVDVLNAVLLSTDMAVIIADIDFFKKINDDYGHLAGDRTLVNVAATLAGCLQRTNDWIARYGGEEFLICMPGANLGVARRTAENMRQALEQAVIEYSGSALQITASFGICCLKSAGHESAESLIRLADEKLYLAKRNGRNRVEY